MFGKKPLLPILLLVFVFVTTVLITVISGQGGVGDIRNRAAESPYAVGDCVDIQNQEICNISRMEPYSCSWGPTGCTVNMPTVATGCKDLLNITICNRSLVVGADGTGGDGHCAWNYQTNSCVAQSSITPTITPFPSECSQINEISVCTNSKNAGGTPCFWDYATNSCTYQSVYLPTPTLIIPAPGSYCQIPSDAKNFNCSNCQYGYERLTTCVNNYCGKCLIGWSTPTQIPPTVTPTRIIPTSTPIVPSATPTRIIPTNTPISFVTNTPRPTPSPTPSGKSSGFYCLFFPNAPQCKK